MESGVESEKDVERLLTPAISPRWAAVHIPEVSRLDTAWIDNHPSAQYSRERGTPSPRERAGTPLTPSPLPALRGEGVPQSVNVAQQKSAL
jgi:hypothetical protein